MVYGNILDETLDFVARFETLDHDMAQVRQAIGKADGFSLHCEKGDKFLTRREVSGRDAAHIARMYRHDIERFGY